VRIKACGLCKWAKLLNSPAEARQTKGRAQVQHGKLSGKLLHMKRSSFAGGGGGGGGEQSGTALMR
jgi:hypothetical protein